MIMADRVSEWHCYARRERVLDARGSDLQRGGRADPLHQLWVPAQKEEERIQEGEERIQDR